MKIKYEVKERIYKDLKYWKTGDVVIPTTPHEADVSIFENKKIKIGHKYRISNIFIGRGPWEGQTIINIEGTDAGFISDSFLNISNG